MATNGNEHPAEATHPTGADRPAGQERASPADAPMTDKTVILGVGNLLMSDEGVGVHVAHALEQLDLPDHIAVVEGGTDGFRLMNVIEGAARVIVIDAIKGGCEPGTLYRFGIDEVPPHIDAFRTSVHQVGIQEVIQLVSLVGERPPTTILGIEPACLEMGLELSGALKARLPRLYEILFEELGVEMPAQIPEPSARSSFEHQGR